MKRNILIILLATLLLAGCTGRDMAHINQSMEAESLFKGWPLPDQYEYYFHGTKLKPIAFLALDKTYSMESEFWTRIFPTSQMREFWQEEIQRMWLGLDDDFRGMEIVASDNQRVGYIYTRYYWVTAWSAESGSKTMIIPPPQPSSNQNQPGFENKGR